MMTYDWSMLTVHILVLLSCCNLITNYEFIIYVAFSHVYFQHQKFTSDTHMVRKTGARKMESIYGWFLEHVLWV